MESSPSRIEAIRAAVECILGPDLCGLIGDYLTFPAILEIVYSEGGQSMFQMVLQFELVSILPTNSLINSFLSNFYLKLGEELSCVIIRRNPGKYVETRDVPIGEDECTIDAFKTLAHSSGNFFIDTRNFKQDYTNVIYYPDGIVYSGIGVRYYQLFASVDIHFYVAPQKELTPLQFRTFWQSEELFHYLTDHSQLEFVHVGLPTEYVPE
jgi:hypothetical protein